MYSFNPRLLLDVETLVGVALLLAGGIIVLRSREIQRVVREAMMDPQVRAFCRNSLAQALDSAFGDGGAGALPPAR